MVAISKKYREKDLQSFLLDFHDLKNRQYDLIYYNSLFKTSILNFGSKTPDNLEAINRIAIGHTNGQFGIFIFGTNVLFKDILTTIEYAPKLYNNIKQELPDLSKKEWQSAIDFTRLLLTDFNTPFGLAYRMKEVFDNGQDDRLNESVLAKINSQTNLILTEYLNRFPNKDLQSAFDYLEFSMTTNKETNTKRYGIRLKNYIFLSDFYSILEELKPPSNLIKQADWEAFNRIMVLIFLAFEGNEYIA